jgi:LPP20 lipoprotein
MKTQVNWTKHLILTVCLGFLAACASSSTQPSQNFVPIQDLDAPEWVIKGKPDSGDRAFYGVGLANGIRNTALLRQTADNRARSELSDVFQVYVAKLHKDYQESVTEGDMSASSETQYIERALKSVSDMTLHGSEIVDHWQNPNNGELYALARVDFENFEKNLAKYNKLSREIRDAIKIQAEKSFDDLDKELEKRKGR